MAYTTFTFYEQTYHGNVVPAEEFDRIADRASDFLDVITFDRLVDGLPDNERAKTKVQKAVCAVCDKLYQLELAEKKALYSAGETSSGGAGGVTSGVITSKSAGVVRRNEVDMEMLFTNMTGILAVIGALAFIVSVITQVFKGVGVLAKIPTDILVLVLSIGITVTAFVAYMQYIQQTIIWYMILAGILAGFSVAFVAMYGWEKFAELWSRFKKGE